MAGDLPARRTVFNGPKTVENGRVTRDARGRFVAGNPGGGRPRNPYARAQAQLRCTVLGQVTASDLGAIVEKLVELAKLGNLAAVKLLFECVIGEPPEPVHPDRLEEHELSVRRGRPTLAAWLALTDEQADREPVETDPDEAPAEAEELPLAAVHPQLQAMLSWAVQQLAEAQTRAPLPPPDPVVGWERFAESRLEWIEQAAAPLDMVYLAYARWCTSHGEPVLPERDMLAWLTQRGARVSTGTQSQFTAIHGVRVTE